MLENYTTSEIITICLGAGLIAVSIIRCIVRIIILNRKHKKWMRDFNQRHNIS